MEGSLSEMPFDFKAEFLELKWIFIDYFHDISLLMRSWEIDWEGKLY